MYSPLTIFTFYVFPLLCRSRCDRQHIQINIDYIADKIRIVFAAVRDAVIASVEPERSIKTTWGSRLCRFRIVATARGCKWERDLFRHAMHREITGHHESFALFGDRLALERDIRKLFDIKKVRRPKMLIAAFDAGVDAGSFYCRQNSRFSYVRLIIIKIDRKLTELAANLSHSAHDRNAKTDV